MNTDLQISFFDCCDTSHQTVVSVAETTQTRYTVVERVLRRFKRWFTVTAKMLCRVFRPIRPTRLSSPACLTGVQRLHKLSILRF